MGVCIMVILGAMACPCTEPAVITSPTSMASCGQQEGSRRSPGCSSSTCRAFGERSAGNGRNRFHSGARSQFSVEGRSTSGSTRLSFGCPSDGMSRFHPAFSEPSLADGGGTCGGTKGIGRGSRAFVEVARRDGEKSRSPAQRVETASAECLSEWRAPSPSRRRCPSDANLSSCRLGSLDGRLLSTVAGSVEPR